MTTIDQNKFNFVNENNKYIEEVTYYNVNIKKRILKNRKFKIGLIMLMIIIMAIAICPSFSKWDITDVFKKSDNMFPSKDHWFGISQTYNDLYVMLWVAAKNTFRICFKVIFFDISIGFIFGGICSYYGGIIDCIIMRIIEIMMSIHVLVWILLLYIVLGQNEESLVMALAINGCCNIITSTRGQLLQIREQEYILAAKSLGASVSRIVTRHFFRNMISIIIVILTLEIPNTILIESSFSFMGLGVNLTLGKLMEMNRGLAIFYPYTILIPMSVLIIISLSFNLIGDGLINLISNNEIEWCKERKI